MSSMSINLPSRLIPLWDRILRWSLRSYPYLIISGHVIISLKSSDVPQAAWYAPLSHTATVIFLISVKIPVCTHSVIIATFPEAFAMRHASVASTGVKQSFFSSLAAVGCTLPIYFLNDPNSYFSKRSATAGSYAKSTAMSSLVTSSSMSVLMVTSSWLMPICPRAFSKASLCFGVSSLIWA